MNLSIIIPTLNSARYLRECLDSVLNQNTQGFLQEILIIDAHSSDGTEAILREFAKRDSRIRIFFSERKSYGYQVNLGISKARGEYIGIVESDDFIKPNMFWRLYSIAKTQNCDIVKSDILCFHSQDAKDSYTFTYKPIVKNRRFYGKKLNFTPHSILDSHATKSIKTKIAFLKSAWKMNQGSIFKHEFLEKYNILFNQTDGASYQDTSFSFISTICASSIYVLNEAYYCYRTDNETSSTYSKDKIYCICDEYDYIARFLEKEHLMSAYSGLFYYLKFCGYKWNLGRISTESKLEFLYKFQKEFAHLSKSQIKSCNFKWHQRRKLAKILDSPRDFYAELLEPKPKNLLGKIRHYFTKLKEQKCNQKSQS